MAQRRHGTAWVVGLPVHTGLDHGYTDKDIIPGKNRFFFTDQIARMLWTGGGPNIEPFRRPDARRGAAHGQESVWGPALARPVVASVAPVHARDGAAARRGCGGRRRCPRGCTVGDDAGEKVRRRRQQDRGGGRIGGSFRLVRVHFLLVLRPHGLS